MQYRQNQMGHKYLSRTGLLAILFIIFIFLCLIYMLVLVNENKKTQKDINEIHNSLTSLYISVINQETGQRGFIITKNEDFLEPFQQGYKVFKEEEVRLIQYIESYPKLLESIYNTIENGNYWTSHFGSPQIHLVTTGNIPSQTSLETAMKVFDNFRVSYEIAYANVEEKKSEIQDGFRNRLIILFSFSAVFFILIFTFIWFRMYREFKSIIIPIEELSLCMKEYTNNIFSKNTPLYEEDNELGELISHVEVMRLELEKNRAYMEKLAFRDGLTGALNRRYFDSALQNEWNKQKNLSKKLSIILFDVDFFKKFNDTYGHVAGDDCLRKIVEVTQSLFPTDAPARYGGEEFAIIVIDQDENTILKKAEQLRSTIEGLKIPHALSKVSDWVTISAGVATIIPDDDSDVHSFINLADQALYTSKTNGRNQVSYHTNR